MIEQIWEYKSIICVVRIIPETWYRCGYALIPDELYPKDINEVDVHGGVTYINDFLADIKQSSIKDYKWIGFDCYHSNDCGDIKYASDEWRSYIQKQIDLGSKCWSLPMVIQETERMVDSILKLNKMSSAEEELYEEATLPPMVYCIRNNLKCCDTASSIETMIKDLLDRQKKILEDK